MASLSASQINRHEDGISVIEGRGDDGLVDRNSVSQINPEEDAVVNDMVDIEGKEISEVWENGGYRIPPGIQFLTARASTSQGRDGCHGLQIAGVNGAPTITEIGERSLSNATPT